jgi:hypothetical protein
LMTSFRFEPVKPGIWSTRASSVDVKIKRRPRTLS